MPNQVNDPTIIPRNRANDPIVPLELWKAGDRPSARHFNQPVEALNDLLTGVSGPRQVIQTGRNRFPELRRFKVVDVEDDTLRVTPLDDLLGDEIIDVAKPEQLQRTPFDGKTRTVRGNEISYVYVDGTERTATVDSEEEEQVIVPAYILDDIILCAKGITEGTGLTVPAFGGGVEDVVWEDLNNDARAWAKKDDD